MKQKSKISKVLNLPELKMNINLIDSDYNVKQRFKNTVFWNVFIKSGDKDILLKDYRKVVLDQVSKIRNWYVSDILEDIKTLSEKRDSIESKTSKEYKDLSEEIVALTKKRNIKINSLWKNSSAILKLNKKIKHVLSYVKKENIEDLIINSDYEVFSKSFLKYFWFELFWTNSFLIDNFVFDEKYPFSKNVKVLSMKKYFIKFLQAYSNIDQNMDEFLAWTENVDPICLLKNKQEMNKMFFYLEFYSEVYKDDIADWLKQKINYEFIDWSFLVIEKSKTVNRTWSKAEIFEIIRKMNSYTYKGITDVVYVLSQNMLLNKN